MTVTRPLIRGLQVVALALGALTAGPSLARAQHAPADIAVHPADALGCYRVAFSHDGRTVATLAGAAAASVVLWERATGRPVATSERDRSLWSSFMGPLVFRPDDQVVALLPVRLGRPLYYGTLGGRAGLWRTETGAPVTAPPAPEVIAWAVQGNRDKVAQFLAGGAKLHAVSANGMMGAIRSDFPRNAQRIEWVDLRTGKVVRALDAVFNDVLGMTFSPGARFFSANSSDRRFITVWDVASGRELVQIKDTAQLRDVGQVAFSPDERRLAVQHTARVDLYETERWSKVDSFPTRRSSLTNEEWGLAYSPDGRWLASANGWVDLYDVAARRVTKTLCSPPGEGARALDWAASGAFAVGYSHAVKLWLPAGGAQEPFRAEEEIQTLTLAPDGTALAFGTRTPGHDGKGNTVYYGRSHLWRLGPEREELPLQDPQSKFSLDGTSSESMAFSRDGKRLLIAMQRYSFNDDEYLGVLTLWDPASQSLLRMREQPDPELNAVAFSADGQRIATAQQDNLTKIYSPRTLSRTHAFPGPRDEVAAGASAVAFSPDGRWLLAGSRSGGVWRVAVADETEPHLLRAAPIVWDNVLVEAGRIVSVFFSGDGQQAYAVDAYGVVRRWSTRDWSDAGEFRTADGAHAATLSPDKAVLAIASLDGAVRFYDLPEGEWLFTLVGTEDAGSELAIARDGAYDFGRELDLELGYVRNGRNTVSLDEDPASHRQRGLFKTFLALHSRAGIGQK